MLESRYGVGTVSVFEKRQSGIAGPILRLTVTNSPLLRNLGEQEEKQEAVLAAVFARSLLSRHQYSGFEIVFARRIGGIGVSVGLQRRYVFSPAELSDAPRVARSLLSTSGAFYSIDNSDGGYRALEILEGGGSKGTWPVEGRLYGNHFSDRPRRVGRRTLSVAAAAGFEGPGIERIEVTPRMWLVWQPRLLEVTGRE